MAVPKRRHSKSRRDKRRGGQGGISLPHAALCPQCHNPRESHRVCPHCGYYKGKVVAQVKAE